MQTFKILTIGKRNAGKTVFLAGCYTELKFNDSLENSSYLLEGKDSRSQKSMEEILKYISQKRKYPPPTLKITDFYFSLKRRTLWHVHQDCNFRWIDLPGEYCNNNVYRDIFSRLVLASHGCCVFIDADALINDDRYKIDPIERQVGAIASLARQNNLSYPIAIVLTKCDLFQLGPISQLKIEENIQILLSGLNGVRATYKKFYSAIPLAPEEGILKPKNASNPIVWLAAELVKNNTLQSSLENRFRHSLKNESKIILATPSFYRLIVKYIPLSLIISCLLLLLSIGLLLSRAQLDRESLFKLNNYLRLQPNK